MSTLSELWSELLTDSGCVAFSISSGYCRRTSGHLLRALQMFILPAFRAGDHGSCSTIVPSNQKNIQKKMVWILNQAELICTWGRCRISPQSYCPTRLCFIFYLFYSRRTERLQEWRKSFLMAEIQQKIFFTAKKFKHWGHWSNLKI